MDFLFIVQRHIRISYLSHIILISLVILKHSNRTFSTEYQNESRSIFNVNKQHGYNEFLIFCCCRRRLNSPFTFNILFAFSSLTTKHYLVCKHTNTMQTNGLDTFNISLLVTENGWRNLKKKKKNSLTSNKQRNWFW